MMLLERITRAERWPPLQDAQKALIAYHEVGPRPDHHFMLAPRPTLWYKWTLLPRSGGVGALPAPTPDERTS